MTADELKKLEAALTRADDLFLGQYVYGPRTIEIREELRALVAKVVMERIRAESREQQSRAGTVDNDPELGPPRSRLDSLERSVKVFDATVRDFETAHQRLIASRRGASDSMMVNLDELMSANQQSLISVLRILATTKEELEQERRRSE